MLAYPFEKVPGFLCEVGWEVQFAFKNFVNSFLPVLSCKGGLERQETPMSKKNSDPFKVWMFKNLTTTRVNFLMSSIMIPLYGTALINIKAAVSFLGLKSIYTV